MELVEKLPSMDDPSRACRPCKQAPHALDTIFRKRLITSKLKFYGFDPLKIDQQPQISNPLSCSIDQYLCNISRSKVIRFKR